MPTVVPRVAGNYGVVRHRNVPATVFGIVQNVSMKTICKHYEHSHFMNRMRRTKMKAKRTKNVVKDIPRGSYRVAEGASVLGEGRDPSDFAHIATATPLD